MMVGAHEHRDAGDLGRGGEERGDRRRRALVDVGRPHVERHRRNLEAEAGEQEHQSERQADAALGGGLGDAGERDRAAEAVNQRGAVEQHAGRQRAENEVFQPGLGRTHVVAADRRDHVERQAHQFEAEIERDQVGRRNQHQHAGGRQQDQHRILEPLLLLAAEIVERHQDRDRRAGQRQELQEAREVVDDEAAAERDQPAVRQHDDASRRPRPAAGSPSTLIALAAASPRNAPSISSTMAPTASTISGRAGSSAGSSAASFIGGSWPRCHRRA